ncbi:glycerophosphodiester phosphodiesterase family protein [Microbulbifer thermotolerans]|uniref:Glycerophosphodiester phosphodiesterase family protein n=1 Tax=Microbulbifer thermotolerans TaxID=252514 RepID=A0AB35HX09_MICTH|nr:glycerophosphodiester phosphodiesterase family protein [Microbulbifer thermotolerans]MCX2780082.1 glycerophosphodiester phosphodiesterase family protein [Microbulbifer thermotolerans]MCX2795905.1 glycerophosphodiester phosphodiesterase family protein [Microbulbifer thermotolerans]MCX2802108.1 glycerophosphodiester phosphodiesterase family protein [Microbulbifer thermotolerans]MCX2805506.1 glycerophosphodiester phosphodiesterase family protein [Microbulbifer thermotolerans]MCX2842468.1 glyce
MDLRFLCHSRREDNNTRYPDLTFMLIAHRGDKVRQPANTIAAFEAAHGLGTCAIQIDVRFSADGTPWCFHDDQVQLPGHSSTRAFHQLHDRELRQLPLNPLIQVVDWASCHRHLDWFIEVSATCLTRLGTARVVETLMELLRAERDSFALLTGNHHCLRLARSRNWHRVALKVDRVARCLSPEVVTLAPDYLLIRDKRVETAELPPGPWQWVVYEINSAEEAVHWRTRGAHHILTGNLPLLMRSREASDVYEF